MNNLIPKEAFDLLEKVYGDVASSGLQIAGKAVADTLKLITLPFSFLGVTSDELLKKYKNFIQKSIEQVPKEKLIAPDSIIVSKLFDEVKYVFDDSELYNMFSKLLASSMNSDSKDSVHVSFVSIIGQMDAVDAKLFREIHKRNIFPVANVMFGEKGIKEQNLFSKLCTFEGYNPMKLSVSIDNLIRLGVVSLTLSDKIPDEHFVQIKNNDIYKRTSLIYEKVKEDDIELKECKVFLEKYSCSFTTLGEILSRYVLIGR